MHHSPIHQLDSLKLAYWNSAAQACLQSLNMSSFETLWLCDNTITSDREQGLERNTKCFLTSKPCHPLTLEDASGFYSTLPTSQKKSVWFVQYILFSTYHWPARVYSYWNVPRLMLFTFSCACSLSQQNTTPAPMLIWNFFLNSESMPASETCFPLPSSDQSLIFCVYNMFIIGTNYPQNQDCYPQNKSNYVPL